MAGGQAKGSVNDWQNVEPSDWQTVPASGAPQHRFTADEVSGGPFMQQVEQEAFGPQMAPPNEGLGHHIMRGISNFGGAAAGAIPEMLMHPVKTVQSAMHMAEAAQGDPSGLVEDVTPLVQSFREHPEESSESMAGNIVGGIDAGPALGMAGDLAGKGVSAIRDAAMGDPNIAALRGLRVAPSSAKSLSTLKSVEGARPYLKGAQSLEDVQARVPEAKNEIWGPYQRTVDAIGGKKVQGPDGPTTVRDLENERLQISANLRALKQGGPEAVQLATQKGMNQADLLAREKAVQSALDPHLEQAGIDPKLIRQTFSNVAQIGGRVAGKSTMAESSQPYGFGRMLNMRIDNPRSWFGEPAQGMRDLAAGRPLWSGKPTDINLREAFRGGGEKPDFRAPYTSIPRFEAPPKLLEANVPGNAPFGEEPYPGSMNGIPERNPIRVTPATNIRGLLPQSGSEANFMRRYIEPEPQGIRTPIPPKRLALPDRTTPTETQPFAIMRPKPPQGEVTRLVPSRMERLQQQGEILPPSGGRPLRLQAPHVPTPMPSDTMSPVFPAGSQFRDIQETPFYPHGSAFRGMKEPKFDLKKYLQEHP